MGHWPAVSSEITFDGPGAELKFGFVLRGRAPAIRRALGFPADLVRHSVGVPFALDGMSEDFRLQYVTTARLDKRLMPYSWRVIGGKLEQGCVAGIAVILP